MADYTIPYYRRLCYYRTMLEMTIDWWEAKAHDDVEEQGGVVKHGTEALFATSNLAHELKMLHEAIEDYQELPPCPACGEQLSWGPLVEFDPREMTDEGPLGTRTCEHCGYREEFGEDRGYGEKAQAEWELDRFPEVAYLWLERFGPAPRFFDEDDTKEERGTTPGA
jgi:hypothetical protein